MDQTLSITKLSFNALLILNNYLFAPWQIEALLPHPLIPPSWSLSTEWHFYLLVPFFYLCLQKGHRFWIALVLFGSMGWALYAFAHAPTEIINSDNFGYRYFPGVAWIFLMGFIYHRHPRLFWIAYGSMAFFTIFVAYRYAAHPFVREITFAALLFPIIPMLLRFNFRHDRIIGALSYPLFLSHFFIFYVVEKTIGYHNVLFYQVTVFGLLLLFSALLALLQTYIDRWRYTKIKYFQTAQSLPSDQDDKGR